MSKALLFNDTKELLFRNISPSWIQDGRVTSQAFRPSKKDKNLLSTRRSAKMTSQEAYEDHIKMDLNSKGVMAVNVEEVNGENLNLIDDSEETGVKAHVSIDFDGLTKNLQKKIGQNLRGFAENRGFVYLPQ